MDNEPLEHREAYIGKRIKRGLFRTNSGKIINADVNGAYNILRKAFPKGISPDEIVGLGLVPYSVKLMELNKLVNLNPPQTNVFPKASRGRDSGSSASSQCDPSIDRTNSNEKLDIV